MRAAIQFIVYSYFANVPNSKDIKDLDVTGGKKTRSCVLMQTEYTKKLASFEDAWELGHIYVVKWKYFSIDKVQTIIGA